MKLTSLSPSVTVAAPAVTPVTTALFAQLLIESSRALPGPWQLRASLADLPSYSQIHGLDAANRLSLAAAAVSHFKASHREQRRLRHTLHDLLATVLLEHLLEYSTDFKPADYIQLLQSYLPTEAESAHWQAFDLPVELTVTRLARTLGPAGPNPAVRDALEQVHAAPALRATYYVPGLQAVLRQLEKLTRLGLPRQPKNLFSAADGFGRLLHDWSATDAAQAWQPLLALWAQATAGKPTQQFRKLAARHVQAIGPEAFARQAAAWLEFLRLLDEEVHELSNPYGGHDYTLTEATYLAPPNLTAAKGLVWSLLGLPDGLTPALLHQLTELATRCYRKNPGVGPWCITLGNACAYVLSQSGLAGAAPLAQLRTKAVHRLVQTHLDKRLRELAASLGLTLADVEDLSIPTHNLQAGEVRFELSGYAARIVLVSATKAELHWQRADGSLLKAVPAALKKAQPAAVKRVRDALVQVQHSVQAQRDRLERAYLTNRRWSYQRLQECYLQHPLVGQLAQALIWRFTLPGGGHHDALWVEWVWHDATGQPLPDPDATTEVQLWHPVLAPLDEVLAWRALLDARQLRQPFKQAYREVYVLTPPEERTNTYSNRMAAHLLRQHQVSALARQRGWTYTLMGGFDHGSNGAALPLPAHQLQAEFWLTEAVGAGETNAGIYQYVSTDQVRFTRGFREVVPLPEVDPLVFSEVMRDVDLFVGVASVGNDPNWRDNGGLAQYRNYWESYSFGELTEVAKTRKLALERLVPRLKIGRVSELKGNFLHVRGHRHVYKIHLGSGNILLEPGDRYLCIVPDRSAETLGAPGVFLPFEGDAVLSIILSKAALLMDDDQITDETILRQL